MLIVVGSGFILMSIIRVARKVSRISDRVAFFKTLVYGKS